MKSTEQLSHSTISDSSENPTDHIKCIRNNSSIYVCTNQDCQKFAFTCADQNCGCQQQHPDCSKLVTKSIQKALKKKVVSFKPIQQKIQTFFEKTIDKIYDYKGQLLEQSRKSFENFYGLQSFESEFLTGLQQGNVETITGKNLWKIQLNLKKLSKQAINVNQMEKRILASCQKFDQQLDLLYKSVRKRLGNYQKGLFYDSQIIQNAQDIKKIQGFFQGKKLKSATLLYRGSQNDFDTQKFHQKCDGQSNNLTICQTQFGKIVGGYTPLAWTVTNQWAIDYTNQSFIFSLTNNHRFNQVNQSNNIYNHSAGGPYFGNGSDLSIPNKANQNHCTSNLNGGYSNTNYVRGNANSHTLYSGGPNNTFRLKQWQFYKIQFET